jgi:hypothetical protein
MFSSYPLRPDRFAVVGLLSPTRLLRSETRKHSSATDGKQLYSAERAQSSAVDVQNNVPQTG